MELLLIAITAIVAFAAPHFFGDKAQEKAMKPGAPPAEAAAGGAGMALTAILSVVIVVVLLVVVSALPASHPDITSVGPVQFSAWDEDTIEASEGVVRELNRIWNTQ